MKRTVKNIIMIGLVVALAGGAFLTFNSFSGERPAMNQIGQSSMGAPPDMQNGDSNGNFQSPPDMQNGNSDNNSDSSDNSQGFQPDNQQNGSDNNQQPPQMNGNADNSSDSSDNSQGFQPDNQQNGSNNNQQPPQMNGNSDNNSDSSDNNRQFGKFGGRSDSDNNQQNGGFGNRSDNSDNTGQSGFQPDSDFHGKSDGQRGGLFGSKLIKYAAFGADSLLISILVTYLLLSRFNKYGFHETLKGTKRVLIYVLCTLVLTSGLTVGQIAVSKALAPNTAPDFSSSQGFQPDNQQNGSNSTNTSASGNTTVTDTQTLTDSYSSSKSDESAILVENGGNATINGSKISKTGDSTNTESSEFNGVNAGVLVTQNSTATIKGADISTDAKGANAVFSTGTDSKIYISDSTITTTGESSARGLDATYGGYIEADNVTISTKGGSCAALATDRGEGTVKVKSSKLSTAGAGSPVIYSTGDISITKTTGTATGAQMAVIEGKNSATVTSSTLTASGKGNRNDVDNCGVMIYQSMSGDASEGKGTFTATDSTLSIDSKSSYYKTAPMFFVTNTDAEINLTNTKLNFGSSTLISAKGTDEWGNSNSNGGNVTLNATKQTLKGNVTADKISTVAINLTNSSFEGSINSGNTAKSATLKLDKSSKVKLTGDTYLTELDDADSSYSNIDFNGYKLYVNGKAVK